MARKKTDQDNLPAKAGGRAVAKGGSWQERMAAAAESVTEREALSGGSYLSIGNDGKFHYGDEVMGDVINVVVLDFAFDNAYYQDAYDPDNPSSPVCFAIGMTEEELAPHGDSEEPQAETCAECWADEFGSAEVGRGKACKNSRRLALLAVDEEDGFIVADDSEMAVLKLPPTSLTGWKSYINRVARVTGMAPFGVVTQLTLVPNKGRAGFMVEPIMVQEVEDPDSQEAIMGHLDALGEQLLTPYRKFEEEEEEPAQKPQRRAPAKKKTAPARRPAAKKAAPARKPAPKKKQPVSRATAAGGSSRSSRSRKF